jgi:hypothetical protein
LRGIPSTPSNEDAQRCTRAHAITHTITEPDRTRGNPPVTLEAALVGGLVLTRASWEPHDTLVRLLPRDDAKPSCLISCSHTSPEGGCGAFLEFEVGRKGEVARFKRSRRGAVMTLFGSTARALGSSAACRPAWGTLLWPPGGVKNVAIRPD